MTMDNQTGLRAIRNLDYTMLLCDDIAAMRTFYHEVLGFELRSEIPDRWAELQIGGTLLALRRRGRPYDGPGPQTPSADVQLAFRVPPGEVEAAAAEVIEAGVELLEPVADLEPFGHRAFFFADPEHNIIEIYAEI